MARLPRRLFDRLNRARLERAALRTLVQPLGERIERFAATHREFAVRGRLPTLARASQELVDLLSRTFLVSARPVTLRDRPRPHRRRNGRVVYEVHGAYSPDGAIEVFARTAVHARPVALRTLLDTLLHEWVHHYDFQAFGDSVHCEGFYDRLQQLRGPAWRQLPSP